MPIPHRRTRNVKGLSGSIMMIIFVVIIMGCNMNESRPSESQPPLQLETREGQPDHESDEAQVDEPQVEESQPSESVPPRENGQFSFKESLQEMSINQKSGRDSAQIVAFMGSDLPESPDAYALHMDEVYIYMRFKSWDGQSIEQMRSMIKVIGDVEVHVEKVQNRIKIDVTDITESFQIVLGDIPPITIFKHKPIEYELDLDQLEEKTGLFLSGREYSTQILVSDKEDSIVLAFPEPMRMNLPVFRQDNQSEKGQSRWLDDQHLQIVFCERSEPCDVDQISFYFPSLYSKTGNYTDFWGVNVLVRRVAERTWFDGDTGKPVGFSDRVRFYDRLVFSPDGSQYIGIVELGGALGDGDGYSYSFVLEQKGKPPRVIEDVFYSTMEYRGLPIQWIDEHRLFYASYYGIYTFDVTDGTKAVIYEMDRDATVNYAVFDTKRDRIYALLYDEDTAYYNRANLFVMDASGNKLFEQSHFSDHVLWAKYSNLDLWVHPTEQGVFWTQVENDQVSTLYEPDEGESVRADGFVIHEFDSGVILLNNTPYGSANRVSEYYYWLPGSEAIMLADLPSQHVLSFGKEFVAVADEQHYFRYDVQSGEWEGLFEEDVDIFLPGQADKALYRVSSSR